MSDCTSDPCRSPCTPLPTGIEPLPSVVDNFVLNFFGSIEKIQSSDGSFVWVLPCDMEDGLPENPRLPGEGVGCYMLRLLEDGITGSSGPQGIQGIQGIAGENGTSAFTVLANSFVQPAIGANVSVDVTDNGSTAFASWIQVGAELFIRTGGYYTVIGISGTMVVARLDSSIASPSTTVSAGVAVVPSGVVGATGTAGRDGVDGAAGAAGRDGVDGAAGRDGVDGAAGTAGTDGVDGATGPAGDYYHFVFQRSVSQPLTPTGNSTPAGWSDDALPGGGDQWVSASRQTSAGVLIGSWSTPFALVAGTGDLLQNGSSTEGHIAEYDSVSLTIRDSGFSVSDISAVGLQTIWLPAGALNPVTTDGATPAQVELTAGNPEVLALEFDPSTEQSAQTSIAMPKSWDRGALIAIFYWSHPATTVNFGVAWQISAVAIHDASPISTAYGTPQSVVDTGGTTDDLYISNSTADVVVAGTPVDGDEIFLKISRSVADAGDTMAVNARLLGVKILFTVDSSNDS